ncbi:MAG: hypothetical protein PQ964_09260 [Methanobacteriaceae archaeon]|jgi:hypothetical protein
MKLKAVLLLVLLFGITGSVSAHGIHIIPESEGMVVIADNPSEAIANKIVDELGLNITVYNFKSSHDVTHELEHALQNPDKKILAVAYQDTVNEFLSKNPGVSNRILVSSANANDIKNALILLNITSQDKTEDPQDEKTGGFLTPFLAGSLIGAIAGLAAGAFWMKRKFSVQ